MSIIMLLQESFAPRLQEAPVSKLPSIRTTDLWDLRRLAQPSANESPTRQSFSVQPRDVRDIQGDCANILAGLAITTTADRQLSQPHRLPQTDICYDWPGSATPWVDRRDSDSSALSVPSLTHSLSGRSSPVTPPWSPRGSNSSVDTLQQPSNSKFHLDSAAELYLAQTGWAPSRNWTGSSNASVSPLHNRRVTVPARASWKLPASSKKPSHTVQPRPGGRVTKRRSQPRSRSRTKPHNNTEYTDEENLWIMYHQVDLHMQWSEIEDAFERHFRHGSVDPDKHRTLDGLQSTYYRLNDECPIIDENGLLTYGEGPDFNKANVKVQMAKVRGGKVPMIDRYATEVVENNYSWIRPRDMANARILAERRRVHRAAWEAQRELQIARILAGPQRPLLRSKI